jgi:hypothetical protein
MATTLNISCSERIFALQRVYLKSIKNGQNIGNYSSANVFGFANVECTGMCIVSILLRVIGVCISSVLFEAFAKERKEANMVF